MDKMKLAYTQVMEAIAELKKVKGFNWSGFKGLVAAVPHVVEHVAKAGQELGLTAPDKERLAIQIILDLVPDSWVPDMILEPILVWLIDKAIARLAPAKP